MLRRRLLLVLGVLLPLRCNCVSALLSCCVQNPTMYPCKNIEPTYSGKFIGSEGMYFL